MRRASRFWFIYIDHSGRLLGCLIMGSPSLPQVRDRALLQGTEIRARYCESYELERESANLIPAEVIGRMLNPEDVRKLIRGLQIRAIPRLSMSRGGRPQRAGACCTDASRAPPIGGAFFMRMNAPPFPPTPRETNDSATRRGSGGRLQYRRSGDR